MAERPSFQQQQYRFAAHIRDPDRHPAPPGVEDRRMAIYRDLFFNNVSQLLAHSLPVLRKILGEEQWKLLMRDYFASHQAHTPLFLEMPQEFLRYLQEERGEHSEDPPFMLELAHYEWVELALSIAEEEADLQQIERQGDLLEGIPVLSPVAWTLSYTFPVHRISPEFQPQARSAEPTFLVVYRRLDDSVGFLEINAVTARLLEILGENEERTGAEILTGIAAELDHPKPETVTRGGEDILENLRRHDIVLGVRKS